MSMPLRGDATWRAEWRALDGATRRHIEKEVRAGRPLDRYDEARLAVGCARNWRSRATLGAVIVLPLLAVAEFVASSVRDETMSWGYVLTLSFAVIVATVAFTLPKTRTAERMNAEVVARGPAAAGGRAAPTLDAIRHATKAPPPGNRPGGARPAPRPPKPPAAPGTL